MPSDSNPQKDWLTKRAEELLHSREKLNPAEFSNSLEELVESMQIYQIELELQNAELIRVQQSLDREKSRLEMLYNNAPVGYCSLNLNGDLLEANKAFYRILTLTEEQIKGKQFSILVHPDSQDDYYFHLKRVRDTRDDQYTILRIGNNQSIIFIKFHTSIVRFDGEDRDILLCTLSDITTEINYQRDLYQSEERFRSLVTSIDDVVFTLDTNQRHTGVYGKWLERFNQTPEDYLGKTSADMMGPELAKIHEKHNLIALAGQSVVYDWNVESVMGKQYFQTSLSPIFGKEREVNGIVGVARNITQQKLAEQALLASEAKYRLIFDNTPIGVFHINQQGVITACNKAFVDIIGSNQDKLIGLNMLKHPNPGVVKALSASIRGEKGYYEGHYIPMTSSRSLFIKVHAEPLGNQHGEEKGGIAIVEDITQRKLAEGALRESEEKYRTLVDSANDIIYSVSSDGFFTFASSNWVNILGHNQDEVIGKTIADFVHPEDVHLCESFLQKVLETGKPQSGVEYRVLHKDGKWRWHRSNGSIRKLMDGSMEYMGVAHDITDLKSAERSLMERMKEINCLYDVSSLGHEAELSLLTYLQQSVNLIPLGFKNPGNTAARITLGDEVVQTENFVESTTRLLSKIKVKNLVIGHIEVTLVSLIPDFEKPFLDEEQTLIDLIAVNMEQVFEREMNTKAINEKNAALQSLNDEKDKILSIIAHDLRSPLSTIIGLSSLLESRHDAIDSNKQLAMVQGVSKTANRLYQLLENLLEWARLKRGKVDFYPQIQNLKELVTAAAGLYDDQIALKQLELSVDIESNLLVFADVNMAQTIVRNLVSNAIKFSHREGQIKVSARQTDDNLVHLSVVDFGIGMNSHMLSNLFRVTSDAGRQGTEDEPSSGFGLPICKELVEKNGGTIWAESQEGFGSVFNFTLPASPNS
ncbi:MAG: PAS domain-containing sensor histidine kinase [Tenuifilaceae bacterium]|nr:PAS domain-containing sensor histidine kinase [Tenuifilaceae bacterium]